MSITSKENALYYIRLTKQSDKGTIEGGHPIYTGYEIYGTIKADGRPKVGSPLRITRTRRNGVNVLGVMTTSVVTEVLVPNYQELGDDCVVFSTANSTYRLDFLTEEEYLRAHDDNNTQK